MITVHYISFPLSLPPPPHTFGVSTKRHMQKSIPIAFLNRKYRFQPRVQIAVIAYPCLYLYVSFSLHLQANYAPVSMHARTHPNLPITHTLQWMEVKMTQQQRATLTQPLFTFFYFPIPRKNTKSRGNESSDLPHKTFHRIQGDIDTSPQHWPSSHCWRTHWPPPDWQNVAW